MEKMKKDYEPLAVEIVRMNSKILLTDSGDEPIPLPSDEFEEEEV